MSDAFKEDPHVRRRLDSIAVLRSDFRAWWAAEGRNIAPNGEEGAYAWGERLAAAAYRAAAIRSIDAQEDKARMEELRQRLRTTSLELIRAEARIDAFCEAPLWRRLLIALRPSKFL